MQHHRPPDQTRTEQTTKKTTEDHWKYHKIITIFINVLNIIIISNMMMMMMISGVFSYGGFSYSYILRSYFGCMPWWSWSSTLWVGEFGRGLCVSTASTCRLICSTFQTIMIVLGVECWCFQYWSLLIIRMEMLPIMIIAYLASIGYWCDFDQSVQGHLRCCNVKPS